MTKTIVFTMVMVKPNNKDDNVYGAVIMASHFESSSDSYEEYGTAPSGRRPSDQAKRPGL